MKVTGVLLLALLGIAAGQYGPPAPGGTYTFAFNGIMILGGHRCVFRDGELTMTGSLLSIGQQGSFDINSGFATTESGYTLFIESGKVTLISLPSTDRQLIMDALARTGVTVDEFFQRTGSIPPENGVFEVLSGSVRADGINYQVSAGVGVVLSVEEIGSGGELPTGPAVQQTQTIYVTEAYQTTTVVESVTLTKYSTNDVYVTVTAPAYQTFDATVTNFVRQTINVPEVQVIRSPAAGNVVVNTVPVNSQTVIVVRDTSTNFAVFTAIGDSYKTLYRTATSFVFQTVTVDVPATTSITQTISRTRVATEYNTVTVPRIIYTTSTVVVTQAPATRGY